jgi:inhibitor of KinA sporulation pathway (predicted exonuclease)
MTSESSSAPLSLPAARVVIVDLEATCSDDGSVPRGEMEIVEIGAVVQEVGTYAVVAEFRTFVRPVRHPVLTPFCTTLTGIRQEDLADAPPYREAIAALRAWLAFFGEVLFCSWGNYDRNQFLQDCAYHDVEYPFGPGHVNLKAEFSRAIGQRRPFGVGEALRRLGLRFEGSPHRGLDDARNIARIVRRVCVGA